MFDGGAYFPKQAKEKYRNSAQEQRAWWILEEVASVAASGVRSQRNFKI